MGRGVVRALVVLAVAGAAGGVLGLAMPRGPLTSGQSLAALALAVVTGLVAGWVLRSRWAAVLAPAAFVAVVEIVRLGATGPSVDAIRLDGIAGIGAFIGGRGFDAVVVLLPMVVGAFWGAAITRRDDKVHRGRRVMLIGAAAVVVILALALARPAGTEPIVGADGEVIEGSIAEIVRVPIGGHEQAIMLRGAGAGAPVLLFLEGGPGGTAIGAMRYGGQALEEDFVVATWDQRGTGKSVAALEPIETHTLAQAVADTVEVTEYLRERFGVERVYLVGNSWGTTLGVLAVQARPDLYHAYVGTGQMVDQQETDRLMYAESLAYAERVGDEAFANRLRALGEPPYEDAMAYPVAISSNPEWQAFTPGDDHDARSNYPMNLLVAEYTLTEQLRSLAGLVDTFAAMYPQLQEIDFRRDVPRLDVPVWVVLGAHEAPGRAVLAREWFGGLEAPAGELVVFDRSGHRPHLEEPGRFAELMAQVALTTAG